MEQQTITKTTKMEKKIKNAIEEYQCSGCISGHDVSCFEKNPNGGVGCGKHLAGTFITQIGKIYLGMPRGFCRHGEQKNLFMRIFKTFEDFKKDCDQMPKYDIFNIPVWKHLNKQGHTLIRGLRPRKNEGFILVILEDCMDKINCLEITQELIDAMD